MMKKDEEARFPTRHHYPTPLEVLDYEIRILWNMNIMKY